jgi:K+-transporting ATPase ATPase B chain
MTSVDIHAGEGRRKAASLAGGLSGPILARAAKDAFVKLDPRKLTGNPVIFATWIVALLSTVSAVAAVANHQAAGFAIQVALLAVGHGAVRQPGRKRRRRAGQGGGRQPARHPRDHQGQADHRREDRHLIPTAAHKLVPAR